MIPMRGLTACQEMERWKRESAWATRFVWTWAWGERAVFQPQLGRDEGRFLCALFRAEVVTEGPWPPLSRNSLTLSLWAQRAHMPQHSTAGAVVWAGWRRGGDRTGRQNQPTNTTESGAQGSSFCVPVLNEPLQRPQGGPKAAWGKSLRPSF